MFANDAGWVRRMEEAIGNGGRRRLVLDHHDRRAGTAERGEELEDRALAARGCGVLLGASRDAPWPS